MRNRQPFLGTRFYRARPSAWLRVLGRFVRWPPKCRWPSRNYQERGSQAPESACLWERVVIFGLRDDKHSDGVA